MSVPVVEANINHRLLAGSEMCSTALAAITNILLRDPGKLAASVHKIRTAFPHKTDMTLSFMHRLCCLSAVIEEGLRLASRFLEVLTRIVATEGQCSTAHGSLRGVCHLPPLSHI